MSGLPLHWKGQVKTMKHFIVFILILLFIGCVPFATKENKSYRIDSDLFSIYEDIMDGGKRLKREVTGREGYSWEKWLVQDKDGNLHVIIVENGKLEAIDPIKTAVEFDQYKPFGGWRKTK